MKIEIDDLDEVMDQIVKMVPPTHKDDNKFLNTLRSLVERNVIVNPSPKTQDLVEKNDRKDLRISSLALLRRDLPAQLRSEFSKRIEQVKQTIGMQEVNTVEKYGVVPHDHHIEEYIKVSEDIVRIRELIPDVREKLRRAHDVVEDAFSKASTKCLESSGYVENFFASL